MSIRRLPRSSVEMRQKPEYTHNNPVAQGYVDDPAHWRYSSPRRAGKRSASRRVGYFGANSFTTSFAAQCAVDRVPFLHPGESSNVDTEPAISFHRGYR